jgi:hypothetical protein
MEEVPDEGDSRVFHNEFFDRFEHFSERFFGPIKKGFGKNATIFLTRS